MACLDRDSRLPFNTHPYGHIKLQVVVVVIFTEEKIKAISIHLQACSLVGMFTISMIVKSEISQVRLYIYSYKGYNTKAVRTIELMHENE